MYEPHNIAIAIKEQARKNGIVIKSMLTDLELGSNTMSAMYHGKSIASDSLARIADYLGCSVDYLLGRESSGDSTSISDSIVSGDAAQEKQTENLTLSKLSLVLSPPPSAQSVLNRIHESGNSLYRVAKATGISESLFSKWKKNPNTFITSQNLVLIADYLGCSVDYLLGRNFSIPSVPSTPSTTQIHDEEKAELLRIFDTMGIKGRTELMSCAFALEEKYKGSAL